MKLIIKEILLKNINKFFLCKPPRGGPIEISYLLNSVRIHHKIISKALIRKSGHLLLKKIFKMEGLKA